MTKSHRFFVHSLLLALSLSFVFLVQPTLAESVAPLLVSVEAVTANQIDLAWSYPAVDHSGFIVEKKYNTGQYVNIGLLQADTTTYSDTGVSKEGEYSYRVTAVRDTEDNLPSNVESLMIIAAPSGLSATSTADSKITLTWIDHSNIEDSYEIERKISDGSFTRVGTVGTDKTSYTDASVSPGVAYQYRVRAAKNDAYYSVYSNTVLIDTAQVTAPATPSNLNFTAKTNESVTLSWTDNANNETGFYIEFKASGGGNFTRIGTVDQNMTTFISTGLTANTSYHFRVQAYNDIGNSSYSNEIVVSTALGVPLAPSNLKITTVTKNSIALIWTNNANNQAGFKIERKKGSGSFTQIGMVGSNITKYTDMGLDENIIYHYRVRAYNDTDDSPYSNEASAATLLTIPTAPSGLKVSSLAKDRVTLEWLDNADNEDGFMVERKAASGAYAQIAVLGKNNNSFTNSGLIPGTAYSYKIRAYNAAGISAYSNEVTTKTPAGDLPDAPANLKATATKDSITLTWTDYSYNETGFKIERRAGTGNFTQIATVGKNVTSYTNTGLSTNNTYEYRVRAYNSYGDSPYTEDVSITTGDTPAAPSNLTVIEITKNSTTLSWTDNADDETGFIIERKTGSGSFYEINTLGANVTTYSNTSLSANTTYHYRVKAYNTSGDSGYSNVVSITAGDVPSAPTDLRVTTVFGTGVTITWIDNATNELGYRIERKTGTGNYIQVAVVGANVTTYSNTGLAANTSYQYRVRAFNLVGDSAYSNEVEAISDQVPVNLTLRVGRTTYYVNQQQKTMDVSPIVLEARTLLPFRYVAEAIGAQLLWDAKAQKTTVTLNDQVIELWIGKNVARVNGVEKMIDSDNKNITPIVVPPGRIMLPLRFIAESLSCSVVWDPHTQEVKISYPSN